MGLQPTLRIRRPRFSLRTLLIGVFALCAFLTIWSNRAMQQHRFVQEIEQLGGSVQFEAGGSTSVRHWGEHFALQVHSVDLSGQVLGSDVLIRLAGYPQIRFLTLSRSNIRDADLRYVAQLKNLEGLRLSSTQVTDRGLHHLSALTNLQSLDVSDTLIGNDGIRWLRRLPRLRRLDLGRTLFTDKGIEQLSTAGPELVFVRLSDTAATANGVRHLGQLQSLQSLNLAGLTLTEESILGLEALPHLQGLNLDRTNFTDRELKLLYGFENLTWISVHRTRVTKSGVAEFQRELPECQVWGF